MFGVNPASAFNRIWPREDMLSAALRRGFELNTTALTLDEVLHKPAHSTFTGAPMNEQSKRPPLAHAIGHAGRG